MPTPIPPGWRLILASAVMLFVELSLIRWLGANLYYLSYFSNFVLMGSFLGVGLGFIRAGRGPDLSRWAPIAVVLLVGFVRAFPVTVNLPTGSLIFGGGLAASGPPAWLTLPLVFIGVAVTMWFVADGVARIFVRFPPLAAYRLDIIGSLSGIIAFTLLGFLQTPPLVWGIVVIAGFVALRWGLRRPLWLCAVAAATIVLFTESIPWTTTVTVDHTSYQSTTSWSPYFKITTQCNICSGPDQQHLVYVNGIIFQTFESVAQRREDGPAYLQPYVHLGRPPGNVLVIGAGTGMDVAIALSEGARHVDAVEIDPRIAQIGQDANPAHPYQDPRVSLHIDDGRAFLENGAGTYDLILFALPDSKVLVSGQSSLRLESYLLTEEAMQMARAHLAPDGVFSEYNYYKDRWLVDRYGTTLTTAFGHPPCVDSVGSQSLLAVLTIGRVASTVACTGTSTLWASQTAPTPAPVHDDDPFQYLQTPGIPTANLVALTLVLITAFVMVRATGAVPIRTLTRYVDVFCMGMAFLLLEAKSVVQFSLLFGSTWVVNAIVFAGVLLSVLLAIETVRLRTPRRPRILYGALLAALTVGWLVPPNDLLGLDVVPRIAMATMIGFAPIVIANIIFAARLQQAEMPGIAFGANLAGAMCGGILEYLSLVLGYRALFIVIACCYAAAFLTGRFTSSVTQASSGAWSPRLSSRRN